MQTNERESGQLATTPHFRFVEFNQRRAMRGVEAARVEVIYSDGEETLIWMSKADISKNMMAFGRCQELTKAFQAYKGG